MKNSKETCVFGPIQSRRLGVSLGIDLLPFKTCSMDCIYCECGKTTNLTSERKEWFPTDKAIRQIDEALNRHPHIDYITFSGVGEPTLDTGIGTIIAHIRTHYPAVKVCLLTNSTMFPVPGFIEQLADCDLIIPSLDGSNAEELRKMNRPVAGTDFEKIVESIARLKTVMHGRMWLEIFIAKGINDSRESAERFEKLVARIRPDKVQLNTLDRPGTERDVEIPDPAVLKMMSSIIGRAAPVECIGGRAAKKNSAEPTDIEDYNADILNTVASRPCTALDIASTLGFDEGKVEAHMRRLEKAGLVVSESGPRGIYYRRKNS